jgi:threonine dehydratase
VLAVGPDDIVRAAERIAGIAHRTPLLTSSTLDARVGASLYLKAENLQRAGAFKFRGAYNAIALLSAAKRAAGVVAFSSGNHAQAVALASRLLEVEAVVIMPADAPAAKLAATRAYGAEVVTYDRYRDDRNAIAAAIVDARGLSLIPPFDHPDVIAGQGTLALEMLDDEPELDVLVVPISGGGLIAGCAVAARYRRPGIRLVGVEPVTADDFRRSLETGAIVHTEMGKTIADGLQATAAGELTFAIAKQLVDEVVTVTDDEIIEAMVVLFERMRIVVEPSGAVGLAALLAGRIQANGRRIGIVLSGGNMGAIQFAELVTR